MINPRALKLFHIIVEKGSLSAASETFHLSPPAASRLISILEDELGFSLFSRDERNLTLSENGRRFWRETQSILINYESIETVATNIRENTKTHLRVLSTSPIAAAWIAPALTRLQRSYPELACAVEILARVDWQSNVGSRTHDVAIGSLPIPSTSAPLKTTPLCEVRIEAIMHKDHPLANKSILCPNDIAAYPFVALYRGQIGRNRSDEIFQAAGLAIKPQFETSSSLVSLALCREKLAISLMPSIYLSSLNDPSLISRPITPERWLLFGAITSGSNPLSEVQRDFIACLKRVAEDWSGTKLPA